MTDNEIEQWFLDFDERKDKMKWFITEFFPGCWEELMEKRETRNHDAMRKILNEVWFWLPDGRFNLKNDPAGFRELLYLVEL